MEFFSVYQLHHSSSAVSRMRSSHSGRPCSERSPTSPIGLSDAATHSANCPRVPRRGAPTPAFGRPPRTRHPPPLSRRRSPCRADSKGSMELGSFASTAPLSPVHYKCGEWQWLACARQPTSAFVTNPPVRSAPSDIAFGSGFCMVGPTWLCGMATSTGMTRAGTRGRFLPFSAPRPAACRGSTPQDSGRCGRASTGDAPRFRYLDRVPRHSMTRGHCGLRIRPRTVSRHGPL